LDTDQAVFAAGFARKGDDKFDGITWTLESGVPRLDGSSRLVKSAAPSARRVFAAALSSVA
jgi:hypothetical protein